MHAGTPAFQSHPPRTTNHEQRTTNTTNHRNMRTLILTLFLMSFAHAQPAIEPGVSQELAKWRASRYSDVHYKLELKLEKMSPVLKGTMQILVTIRDTGVPIVLDWRKIKGHEEKSAVFNVSINGRVLSPAFTRQSPEGGSQNTYEESNEHLVFRNGVAVGTNVIRLDFTSPILPSGSAITRYVDKEDASEYIYSLFVPSDASTAFPVFDQPDLKAGFIASIVAPEEWKVVSNTLLSEMQTLPSSHSREWELKLRYTDFTETKPISTYVFAFAAGPWSQVSVPPAVAGGSVLSVPPAVAGGFRNAAHQNSPATAGATDSGDDKSQSTGGNPTRREGGSSNPKSKIQNPKWTAGRDGASRATKNPPATAGGTDLLSHVYVRRSQLAKFQPHAAEVFRLNREGIKFLEEYFDYKFPFSKYDLVLIPEFPFGGMEHAGATFLRESAVIFPSEPTANDHISRANVIFHEAAHQWFGDTVTMKWFDDLWLKEGFAEFMAYKTLERVMPQYNAWKVFYERNKPLAYATDSTRGTTPIYQEIKNLNSAKSAYGNIVYRKAPSFLKQAEFYLGANKFQTAVRAFLKKHEYANAEWKELVSEFEIYGGRPLTDSIGMTAADLELYRKGETVRIQNWALLWVATRGSSRIRLKEPGLPGRQDFFEFVQEDVLGQANVCRPMKFNYLVGYADGRREIDEVELDCANDSRKFTRPAKNGKYSDVSFIFPNYQDYGYGVFLLDNTSRDYVLKNIQNEKDDFLRSMMWGALWDSVREGELDPTEYVELAIKNIGVEKDELTIQTILARVSTAMTYYRLEPRAVATGSPASVEVTKGNPVATAQGSDLQSRLESVLIDKMRNAPTLGQRITYYRAFLNIASSENGSRVLKNMLGTTGGNPTGREGVSSSASKNTLPTRRVSASTEPIPLKTKDRFDIVTKLASLSDPDAEKLLTELEKTETTDDAKRYAYAARAAFPTKETKDKYWNDFINGKDISESWIEAAFGPFNSVRHADLTLPYLERALKELPNHKRNRKIFFVNGWLAAFIGGQKSEEALAIVNKFLADNPNLDRDLRLKILENVDVIERAVKIRGKFATR